MKNLKKYTTFMDTGSEVVKEQSVYDKTKKEVASDMTMKVNLDNPQEKANFLKAIDKMKGTYTFTGKKQTTTTTPSPVNSSDPFAKYAELPIDKSNEKNIEKFKELESALAQELGDVKSKNFKRPDENGKIFGVIHFGQYPADARNPGIGLNINSAIDKLSMYTSKYEDWKKINNLWNNKPVDAELVNYTEKDFERDSVNPSRPGKMFQVRYGNVKQLIGFIQRLKEAYPKEFAKS